MTNIQFMILALVLQLAAAYVSYQYLLCRRKEEKGLKSFFKPHFSYKDLLVCAAAYVISVWVFSFGFMLGEDTFMRAFMNAVVLQWLVLLGWIDLQEKIIPNVTIAAGLVFWLVLLLVDIFVAGTDWLKVLVFSGLGGLVIGGVLLVIALIVKSALGMGDVKMFFVVGLLYGISDAYSILLFSVIAMGLTSIVLLILKKVTIKTAIPMAPFVALGFLLGIIAGM